MTVATIPEIIGAEGIFTDGDWVESKDQDPEGEVRLIQLADIGVGAFLDKSNRRLTSAKARELRCTMLKAGDLLIARMPDPIGRACIFPELPYPCATVVDVCVVRIEDNSVDRNYVAWMLNSPQFLSDVLRHAKGSTRKRISRKNLGLLSIPLPPLEEQKRIAGILDQAAELCRLRTRALDKLNTLGQAIFHEMFGDSGHENVQRLSQVAELINGDRSSAYPSGGDIQNEGILFLSTKNIRNWRLDLKSSQYISEEKFASLSRGKLQRGDIVITLRGTLGQAAIFDCGHDTGFINAQMMIIRAREGVSPQYLLDYLALDSTQHELIKGQSGSAVRQLTAGQVGKLPVIVPTQSEQEAYRERVAQVAAAQNSMAMESDLANALFASLQHRAFRGELGNA